MSNQIRELINKSSEYSNSIGSVLCWSITGFRDSVTSIRDNVNRAGLDGNLVGNVRNKTAFLKSVDHVAKEIGARVEKGPDNQAVCVRIIIYTQVDPDNYNVTVQTSTKAVLVKGTGEVKFRDLNGQELTQLSPAEEEIKNRYNYWLHHYDSDQMRDLVLYLLKHYCDYLTVRDRGGMYFVPRTNDEQLSKIKALFALYPEASLLTLGVPDTANERRFMWDAFKAEVEAEIKTMETDFSDLTGVESDRSIKVRVERFAQLEAKVDNYAFLLQGTADKLKDRLGSLAKTLTGVVGEETTA
jgi:hypothetical protein